MYAHQHRRSSTSSAPQSTARYAPRDTTMQSATARDTTQSDANLAGAYDDFGLAMASFAEWELDDGPEHGDPLERARAVGPLAPQVDGALDVRTEEDVARSSRENTEDWNTAFLHLDQDPKLGFTLPTVGPEADPSMAMRIGFAGERSRANESAHLTATGIQTLADYRAMVTQDFNFGGLVERVANVRSLEGQDPELLRASGEDRFILLAMERFHPGLTPDDPTAATTVEVARNLWSYATCGYDVEGRTDISELQGLLYLFDSHIRDSSDTNTEMTDGEKEGDWFIIPGTEDWDEPLKARRGDGRHGTATVRTTRHLMAKLDSTSLRGFDESYLLLDRTGSMGEDEYQHLSSLLKLGGLDGTVALASFHSQLAKYHFGNQLSQGDAQHALTHPEGVLSSYGSEERTVQSALEWLQHVKARDGLQKGETVRRQMVVVTDAPDNAFDVGDLKTLQDLARELNMSVKVMYSYTGSRPNAYETSGADSYMLIDLLKVDLGTVENHLFHRYDNRGSYEGVQLDWRKVGDDQGAMVQQWPR